MSNMFKSNSRFSSLMDDIPEQKKREHKKGKKEEDNKTGYIEEKFNTFKSDTFKSERRRDNFRPYDEKERERY